MPLGVTQRSLTYSVYIVNMTALVEPKLDAVFTLRITEADKRAIDRMSRIARIKLAERIRLTIKHAIRFSANRAR